MAQTKLDLEPNVIDPRWILDAVSGRLTYSAIRVVRSHPVQALLVREVSGTKMSDRYLRIMADRRRRRDA
jgi:hypothetical protein